MEKAYSPKEVEDRLQKSGFAMALLCKKVKPNKEAYSIVIPPPNVTGVLTMGHVLNNTVQDILARRARQNGKLVLYGCLGRIMPELPPKPKLKMRSRKWVEPANRLEENNLTYKLVIGEMSMGESYLTS